jgi:NAD(P)-dependent dehydrogenase (short-subunit alcohol dehydrogenase family)
VTAAAAEAALPIDGLLRGKVALVTGAARGMGRATSLVLARAGAAVAALDLDASGAEQVAGEVAALGCGALAVAGDVASDADRRRAVADTTARLGPIDILVNVAGVLHIADPFELEEDDWDRTMAINAKAVFFLTRQVLAEMRPRKTGAVVSVASVSGKLPGNPAHVHYNASKAAVIAITKSLARAVAADGIRVNCVCPGLIDTEMYEAALRRGVELREGVDVAQLRAEWLRNVPLGREGSPEEVAKVIVTLASPLASYMTGQAVNVSGGWVTY